MGRQLSSAPTIEPVWTRTDTLRPLLHRPRVSYGLEVVLVHTLTALPGRPGGVGHQVPPILGPASLVCIAAVDVVYDNTGSRSTRSRRMASGAQFSVADRHSVFDGSANESCKVNRLVQLHCFRVFARILANTAETKVGWNFSRI